MGHIFHATHALEGVHQHLDDLLVTVDDNCGEEFHISKLFLTTVQMYVRVAVVTDHLEAPRIRAGRVRAVTSRSDLRLAVPADLGNGDIVIIGLETVKHVCEGAQLVRGLASLDLEFCSLTTCHTMAFQDCYDGRMVQGVSGEE